MALIRIKPISYSKPLALLGWKARLRGHARAWVDRDGFVVSQRCTCSLNRNHEEFEPPDEADREEP